MNEKALLRRLIRSQALDGEQRAQESAAICRHILESPWYREARVIGGYMPMQREADVLPVLQDALASGRTLALPLCGEAPHMTLRRVSSLEELRTGAYGIAEPEEDMQIIPVEEIDLLLTPLEGIDPKGMRLGKGGGYYDCLLAGRNVRTMGCALSWQKVDCVPAQPWDQPLAACADRNGIQVYPSYDVREEADYAGQEEKEQ